MSDHEDNNEIQLVDLDPIEAANVPEQSWVKRRALAWQRVFSRRRARGFGALVLVSLVIVVLLAGFGGLSGNPVALFRSPGGSLLKNSPAEPSTNIRAARVLLPQQAGIICLADAAWSPDSRAIAMIGYQKTCLDDGSPNGLGMLIVYDARSGKLNEHLSIDTLILSAFHRQFSGVRDMPVLDYLKIVWSPDGSSFALPFWVDFQKLSQGMYNYAPEYAGLLLLAHTGAQPKIFLEPLKNNVLFTEWDAMQGTSIQASSGNALFLTNPLATDYRWSSNGTLIPLDLHKHILTPVGNPQGGSTFTVWQPGTVQIDPPYNGPGSQQSAVYAFNTFFTAWSPDGRYIATIEIVAHVALPGQPAPPYPWPNAQHSIPPPNVPVRYGDAAFQHALNMISGPLVPSNLVMLSWRLDGRVLAVYNSSTTELEILDCATGNQTISLLLSTSVPPGRLTGSYLLYWSPNGKHLLMFDPDVGQVLTWNVG